MIYLIASIILVLLVLMCKQTEHKKNLLVNLAIAIIAYECYLCLIAGVLTVIHIPVNTNSISIINLILSFIIAYRIIKTKAVQKYYLPWSDLIFVAILCITSVIIFTNRFSKDLLIVFETSDPGTHLKLAMDFVNNNAVDGMYFGSLINGLFIESMENFFAGAFVYKSFLLQCGFNLFMAGFIFFATVRRYASRPILLAVAYAATFAYMLGYPYNDMLFGFVYLQLTISVICFIVCVVQEYLEQNINFKVFGFLAGIGCLSVGIGYTLFAPIVYIAVLCIITYVSFKEKNLIAANKKFFSKLYIFRALYVFFVPTFLTLWFLVINPILHSEGVDYGSSLNIEGYIYRNLFSDFWIFALPAIFGLLSGIRNKKINLLTFLSPLALLYYIYFLCQMLSDKVSTYYFYKLNFMLWLIVLLLFVIGMYELFQKDKVYFGVQIAGMLLLIAIFYSGFESTNQTKNINYMPYADTGSFFRIYAHNEIFMSKKTQIAPGLVEISDRVNHLSKEDNAIFIGYWLDMYWYEALTNQRLTNDYRWFSYSDLLIKFMNGIYGDYAVITKDLEGLEEHQDYIAKHCIFENDYAYVIQQ